ncbi:alpha/beta hydrolase [Halpernia frigidisoli]|uniref:Predicted hydrolase of the alpha/beta superfamily n=1 Tax=Halpernia frigidisoli TaxID=1125876 RepID=A0A1I3FFE0_9FLAO|nr:alpha/beta hydrolase-fold protein [Halpernia frigidisoli]SFI09906.1 Predicted hydrolase of the alpha/beta superfamily [Halpernia frigidisoli]
MKYYFLLFALLINALISAQIAFKITSLPENTPKDAKFFMASSSNNWNPSDPNFQFINNGDETFSLEIPENTENFEYKITEGSWDFAEGDLYGNTLSNRKYNALTEKNPVNIQILSWQKLAEKKNTLSSNVTVLSENFSIPQLKTTRKIWIYLPPNYATSKKKYPVVYMEDGQNLFNDATSFSGEWKVDETLNALFSQHKTDAIVIGIENGGAERLNEYSPWINKKYGGGKGDLYVDFLANTLKPFVDKNYRTLAQPKYTGLIGSSMGGLISFYAGVKYPNKFGKLGIFSPSFWFAPEDLTFYIRKNAKKLKNSKIYFYAGLKESEDMVPDIQKTEAELIKLGVPKKNIRDKFSEYGTHSESYWSQEFGQAFEWLFENNK